MQSEDNQIHVPPSFIALYRDARQRLLLARRELHARYELCEDLAAHLVAQAQTIYQLQTPCEAEILRRMHAGLCSAESGVSHAEAQWVVTRLAELLVWRCPELIAPQGGAGE